jgi:hypothetical protein
MALADHHRWIAPQDGTGGHRTADDSRQANYGASTDAGAGGYHGLGRNPDFRADGDRAEAKIKPGVPMIVVAGTEIGTLGQADVGADGDRTQVVDPDVFAEPAMVGNGETPGKFDPQPRFDPAAPAEARSK